MTAKEALRAEVWEAMRTAGVGRFPGIVGRIPNFVGAEAAATRLADTEAWAAASSVKANPDSPQWPVRTQALNDGKVVYMAVPRLASDNAFWRLDPDQLTVAPRKACSIRGAALYGQPVTVEEMDDIDLVVCGSVAVDRDGARLGKGGGFADLEFALALEAGSITDRTVISTTVHPVQVLEPGRIPITEHDFPVDLVVTAEAVLTASSGRARPQGILWDHLDDQKIEEIPELVKRRP